VVDHDIPGQQRGARLEVRAEQQADTAMPVGNLVASEDNSIAVDLRARPPAAVEAQTRYNDVVGGRADIENANERCASSGSAPESDRAARRASSVDTDIFLKGAAQAAELARAESIDQLLGRAATWTRRPVADRPGWRGPLHLRGGSIKGERNGGDHC
jgi:hypothetical protein